MIMRLIYIILAFEIVFYKFKKAIPRENTLLFIFCNVNVRLYKL